MKLSWRLQTHNVFVSAGQLKSENNNSESPLSRSDLPFISLCTVLYCYLQTIPQPSQAITLLTLHNVTLHYITLHFNLLHFYYILSVPE